MPRAASFRVASTSNAPHGTQLLGRFFQPPDLGVERRGLAVRGGVMRIGLLARSERRGGSVAALPGAERSSGTPRPSRGSRSSSSSWRSLLGGFPTRGGDVHQPEAAQLLDEILALRRKEHKVVFRHSGYHNIAPSPAACCLVFTIFWADLERFSSSSMKRLILRMASSYPGI